MNVNILFLSQKSVFCMETCIFPMSCKSSSFKSAGEVIVIRSIWIFCDSWGIVLQLTVPDKTAVNAEYYSHLFCTQLHCAVREKQPKLLGIGPGIFYTRIMLQIKWADKSWPLFKHYAMKPSSGHPSVQIWLYVTSDHF